MLNRSKAYPTKRRGVDVVKATDAVVLWNTKASIITYILQGTFLFTILHAPSLMLYEVKHYEANIVGGK